MTGQQRVRCFFKLLRPSVRRVTRSQVLYRQQHRRKRLYGHWYFCTHISPIGFMWSLRYRERHRFSTRPTVLHFIYDCYLQHMIRFYVVRTETCCALLRRAHRHLLKSAIMVSLMGHTAVQTSVAEGFLAMEARRMAQCRWFEKDLGSEVVFCFDVAHVHHHSRHLHRLGQLRGLGRHESRPSIGTELTFFTQEHIDYAGVEVEQGSVETEF